MAGFMQGNVDLMSLMGGKMQDAMRVPMKEKMLEDNSRHIFDCNGKVININGRLGEAGRATR